MIFVLLPTHMAHWEKKPLRNELFFLTFGYGPNLQLLREL